MTPPPWPVDAHGKPVPKGEGGWPDLASVNWPVVGGQWAPIGPDGRPLVQSAGAAPAPTKRGALPAGAIKGVNGQVLIEGDWLTIHRKGFGRLRHSKGDKRIALATITAVKWRPAGGLANGFIRFDQAGAPALKDSFGGLASANEDENAVIFSRSQMPAFEKLRADLEGFIAAHFAGARRPVAPPVADVPAQIQQLAALRDQGVLTEEEFAAKKAELLARM